MPSSEVARASRMWAILTAACAAAALALAAAAPPRHGPELRAAFATGTVSLDSTRDRLAIVTASGLRPGEAATGTVTLSNTGDEPGSLKLAEAPRGAGGPLLHALALVVDDVTAAPVQVYSGPLDGLGEAGAGALAPGASRVFRFTISLPAAAGDGLQDASATVDFRWDIATASTPPRLLTGRFSWRLTDHGEVLGSAGCTLQTCAVRAWGWIDIGRKRQAWGMASTGARAAVDGMAAIRVGTSRRGARVLQRAFRRHRPVTAVVFVRVSSPDGQSWLVRRRIAVEQA